jgi:hypothetical protein
MVWIQRSRILTGNDLAALASLTAIPTSDEIEVPNDWLELSNDEKHQKAADLIREGQVKEAMYLLNYKNAK